MVVQHSQPNAAAAPWRRGYHRSGVRPDPEKNIGRAAIDDQQGADLSEATSARPDQFNWRTGAYDFACKHPATFCAGLRRASTQRSVRPRLFHAPLPLSPW